ncbi:transposase [Slackia exigua]|nr:transposase [Slackia exigua]
MKRIVCPACGGETKRNGYTGSGRTRWRCKSCGASTAQSYDGTAKLTKLFVSWLLSKRTQAEPKMSARTFRHLTSRFWKLWPILPVCDEVHHVVFADGLWIGRKAALLIACTDDYVIGCHLARSENFKDRGCLMSRIAPPDVLVCDGGGGIEKARRRRWANTRVQRCVFHAFEEALHDDPAEAPGRGRALWNRQRPLACGRSRWRSKLACRLLRAVWPMGWFLARASNAGGKAAVSASAESRDP